MDKKENDRILRKHSEKHSGKPFPEKKGENKTEKSVLAQL